MRKPIPAQYQFLTKVEIPLVKVALSYHGLREIKGKGSDPVIIGWAKKLNVSAVYTDDDMAWCGVFIGGCMLECGLTPPKGYDVMRALKYRDWGQKVTTPALGDVISVKRFDAKGNLVGGHVGIVVGEDEQAWHVLGGNQKDEVSVTRIGKQRDAVFTRPRVTGYGTVKLPRLNPNGTMSQNEA